MAGKRAPKARRAGRKSRGSGKRDSGVGDAAGPEAKPEAGYVGPGEKAADSGDGSAGRIQQLEKPPIADPAKTETPPKPGYTASGKKIGRPTKELVAAEREAQRLKTIEDFSKSLPGIIELPFKAVASKRGDHWLLDDESSGLLCKAITGMMHAYMPLDLGQYLPVIMFGVVLTGVVSSRIVEDAKLAAARLAEAQEREADRSGVPGRRSA